MYSIELDKAVGGELEQLILHQISEEIREWRGKRVGDPDTAECLRIPTNVMKQQGQTKALARLAFQHRCTPRERVL